MEGTPQPHPAWGKSERARADAGPPAAPTGPGGQAHFAVLLLILLVASSAFFTRLGAPRLWDRDEPRNARCAWEMQERNDWIVPTFNGELRAHKPILLYWVTLASYACWGVNEFSARFGSAAAALGTVLLTYSMARRLFDHSVAAWSAIALSTSLMFNIAARAATPDSLLIFCGTLALAIYVAAFTPEQWRGVGADQGPSSSSPPNLLHREPLHRLQAVLMYAAMGLAVLAKGPVGVVLPMGVLVAFGVADRSAASRHWREALRPATWWRTVLALRPFLGLAVVLLVAAPWYVLVGLKTDGAWLREFFLEHNLGRATRAMEGHSGNPLLYYPVVLLVGFFPWTIFTIPALRWLQMQAPWRTTDRRLLFLLAWPLVYLAAFSLASTKLPSYVTPIYPALAILCGRFLRAWSDGSPTAARWWPRWSAACLLAVGVAMMVGLPLAARELLPGEEWLGALGAVPLLGGLLMLWLVWHEDWQRGFTVLAGTAWLLVVGGFAVLAPAVSSHQRIAELLAPAPRGAAAPEDGEHSAEPAPLATYGVHEPSWVYYASREIPHLTVERGVEAAAWLHHPQARLITSRRCLDQLQPRLSGPVEILAEVPYFLRDERLLLIRLRTSASAQASTDSNPPRL